jgi:hypothetical protein
MSVTVLRRIRLTCLAIIGLGGAMLAAQSGTPAADPMLKDLRWRNIGNANLVGRISAIDALEDDWTHVIAGSASGGVWKSDNGGTSWTTIFDNYGSASIGDVKINQKNPQLIWVGTGEGHQRNSVAWGDGIYKSTDGGATFQNVGLKDTYNIARIRLHPTNPDIVYVAALGNIWGPVGSRGLYKTIDGGKTWNKLTSGLPNSPMTGADGLVMDPVNPEILYVSFWDRIRYPWALVSGGNNQGIYDPQGIDGAANGGIYKSTDGGKSWKRLNNGLPPGKLGRIGLAISKQHPGTLMAHIEAEFQPNCPGGGGGRGAGGGGGGGGGGRAAAAGGAAGAGAGAAAAAGGAASAAPQAPGADPACGDLTKLGAGMYRSEDGGATWKFLDRYISRPFYYMQVQMHPLNDQEVFSYTIQYRRSHDGGKTWVGGNSGPGMHCWHAMWFDPHNKNRYYIGSDGGLALTHDDGATGLRFTNINAVQYYDIGLNNADPYWICGGLQDAGSSCGPNMSRASAVYLADWVNTSGGDGYHAEMDPEDPNIVYTESQPDRQGGNITRYNLLTRTSVSVRPNKNNIVNWTQYITPEMEATAEKLNWGRQPANEGPLRYNWSTPFHISLLNPHVFYVGSNHLLMSSDRGMTYRIISPDPTQNDPRKTLRKSGGLTPDEDPGGGAEYNGTIITFQESSLEQGVIWVGTDDGNIQVTRDAGATWTKVGTTGLPGVTRPDIWVSRVEPSHHTAGTAYASLDGHRFAIQKAMVFKTTDYGKTWTSISNNLPDDSPVYVVKEDLKNPSLLFAGTEVAAYYSLNGGQSWNKLSENMPTVAVHDLEVHPRENDLIAATHGRGFWIMDDISPLQQMTAEAQKADAILFKNRMATEWLSVQPQYNGGQLAFMGQNPSKNAIINYYLSPQITGDVRFEISSADAASTCSLTIPAQAGIGRLEWSMRWAASAAGAAPAGQGRGGGRGGGGGGAAAASAVGAATAAQGGPPNFGGAAGGCLSVPGPANAQGGGRGGGGGGGGGGRGGGGGAGLVDPGSYRVTMTANGKTYTSAISVRRDPLIDKMTGAERSAAIASLSTGMDDATAEAVRKANKGGGGR